MPTSEPSHPFRAFAGAAGLALVACAIALAITAILMEIFVGGSL